MRNNFTRSRPVTATIAGLVALLGVGVTAMAAPLGGQSDILSEAKWTYRLLVICGSKHAAMGTPLHESMFEQIDWPGFAERDLVVIGLSPDLAAVWDTDSFLSGGETVNFHLWQDGEPELVTRTGCDNGAPKMSLIGKDGSVKMTWETLVTNAELFALIDAMPMRSEEMRRND